MEAVITSIRGHVPRNPHRLLLGAGCALVLLLLGSSLWQAMDSQQALDDLRQQGARLEQLDGMLIQLMDVENVIRSYLLSGDRNLRHPFREGRAAVDDTLRRIRRDFDANPDNRPALADLSRLVADKLASLDRLAEYGAVGDGGWTRGNRQAEGIRDRLSTLRATLLAEGQASLERSTRHLERTRRVVVGLAVGALALMVALFLVWERQVRLRAQLARVLQGENQRLDLLVRARTEELSDLASHLTNVREAEKARLARELHDELGMLLTAAKMESNQVAERLDGAARASCGERLARLADYLDRGIALKRRIIDDLRPPLLEELGLVGTLRMLGEEFGGCGKEVLTLRLPESDIDLEPPVALAIFRIAQEALTNVRKHARAGSVTLALRLAEGRLELEIADDGIGIGPLHACRSRHGLAGMKHRVQMLAGDFHVVSGRGGGTRIVARIPVSATGCPPAAACTPGAVAGPGGGRCREGADACVDAAVFVDRNGRREPVLARPSYSSARPLRSA